MARSQEFTAHWQVCNHVTLQQSVRGVSDEELEAAVLDPEETRSAPGSGLERRFRAGVAAVVDPSAGLVVTVHRTTPE